MDRARGADGLRVAVGEVRRLVACGSVPDGLTLTALLWLFTFGDDLGW